MYNRAKLDMLLESIVAGFWGSERRTSSFSVPCRVIRNGDVGKNGVINCQTLPIRWLNEAQVDKAKVRSDDCILVSSGAYTGNVGRLNTLKPDDIVIVSNFVRRLRPKKDVNASFLYHALRSETASYQVSLHTSGTAIPNLLSSFYSSCVLPLPSCEAIQSRIAAILDTADEAIANTEAVIEKLKMVKTGMIQDLLSRGLGKGGKLRPTASNAPEFYTSEDGDVVPLEWQKDKLGNRARVSGGKRLPSGHSYAQHPTHFRYLRVVDFFKRHIDFDELESLKHKSFDALARYEIADGEIFISIAGSLGYAGVLKAPQKMRLILTENAAKIASGSSVTPKYLSLQINGPRVQKQIYLEMGVGGGVPKLALFRIENLRIVIPSIEEQQEIVKATSVIASRIDAESKRLKKLRNVKSGLMHDLLNGRVSIRPSALHSKEMLLSRCDA
jgi:type I restriction enzyme S subunit